MHRALLERIERSGAPVALCHFPASRGNLIAAFSPRSSSPEWIAKITRGPDAIVRMQREYENLRYLERWADQLGIPRVLAWDAGVESTCLIITGAKGMPQFPQLRVDSGRTSPADLFRLPFAWLDLFQKLVPLPAAANLGEVVAGWMRELDAEAGMSGTVDALRAALRACASAPWPAPVVVHGDFACCNVLRTATGITVIDWESFGPGAPFQDVFTFVCTIPCYDGQRRCTPLEQYMYLLFSDSRVCAWVRRHIVRRGADPGDLRLAFYAFLTAHLRFQTAVPDQDWRELLDYLARHGYPAPCTHLKD